MPYHVTEQLSLCRAGGILSCCVSWALAMESVQHGAWYLTYLQLKKKLEDEFPGCLDICGEGTPQVTGFFEVMVAGKLVHSKKRGDGYVDTESKFLKLVAAIKAALAQG
uniref:Selenoprotein W n=1 Tax=Spermophilus dauricus TaxID=99837 RepID=A0A8C9Q258_SPEDA